MAKDANKTNRLVLEKIYIKNFKKFDEVEIELGNPVVFVGPNNSGKTTALQALTLWDIGLKRWIEKRLGKKNQKLPEQRPGVTINRKDLIASPVREANLLWHQLSTRKGRQKQGQSQMILIEIRVSGTLNGNLWECGFEFDFANAESFYCRPLRVDVGGEERMKVSEDLRGLHLAFLPAMSGMVSEEPRLDQGRINVLIGEGRTAEVLRNLCYQISQDTDKTKWQELKEQIKKLFGVILEDPEYINERGEVRLAYLEQEKGARFDLSSSGRGLQQTLLLLAFLTLNPGSVLLIDEPDAHLEILRQRQIYQVLSDVAKAQGSQVIIASHSEIVLEEAAEKDVVISFLKQPRRVDDRGFQLAKSLKSIGWDQYTQADQKGWVLYLEGSTDLAILRSIAKRIKHEKAEKYLDRPFVHYVANDPNKAKDHFYGLRAAKENLAGFSLFDNLNRSIENGNLKLYQWQKREIENYICSRKVLLDWAQNEGMKEGGELFAIDWVETMKQSIESLEKALEVTGKGSPWSPDFKVSDDFLKPLFENFYAAKNLPNAMRKQGFYLLAEYVPIDEIDQEVSSVLDMIVRVAEEAETIER